MKKIIVFIAAFIICLVLGPLNMCRAQEKKDETNYLPGYEAVRYGKDDGLLSSEINTMVQSNDGYLWFGAYSGLYRYDGNVFEKTDLDKRISSVMMLFVDSKGYMWIGTNDSGAACFDTNEGSLVFLTKEQGLSSNSIRAIAEDRNGNIYIGTVEGLSVYTSDHKIVNPSGFSSLGGIRSMASCGGDVAGVTASGMLFTVEGEEVLSTFSPDTPGIDYTYVSVTDDDYILVGTSSTELQEFLYVSGKLLHISTFSTGTLSYFSGFYYDKDNRQWYVCAENGMGSVDRDSTGFKNLTREGFESSVCGAYKDYQGNIWFISNKKGIMKFSPNPFTDFFAKAGLSKSVVNSIAYSGNDLYIGKDDGLYVLDPVTNAVRDYHFIENFNGVRVRNIIQDSAGNTWISTYGTHGLYKITPGGKVHTFNEGKGTIGGRFRLTMELNDGTVVAASNLGLSFIANDTVVATMGREQGLETSQILTMVQTEDGTIYAGSDGGGVYVIRDRRVIDCIDEDDGLNTPVVLRIVPYNEGFFYVTSNAVYYDDHKNVKRLNSFPYTNNYDICIGENNKAWVFSSAGIYIADAADMVADGDYKYTLLDHTMGFNTTLTANAWNQVMDGNRLLLCCTDGVMEIDMDEYDYFDKGCYIKVKYILADGKQLKPESDGSYVIPATKGRIQICAAILNYTLSNPEVRLYLEGADDNGVYGRQSTVSELVYTNLPYGRYRLHIQIFDGVDHKVAREEIVDIVKEPRFFERTAVKVGAVLLGVIVVAGIVAGILKVTIIRRQYEQIRVARDEAERANSAKSRFLANMSHEIRTPINTIMGMDEMILREDTENVPEAYAKTVTGYAVDIKRASETLLGLVNDVLDLSKIESGKMNLVEQEYDTNELLRSIVTMIRVRSNQKDLTFETRIDPEIPVELYGDMGKIKQVILNLLTNAVKYTQKGGFVLKAEVREKTEEYCDIYFAVEDTGIGVRKEDMDKLFSAFERLDEKKNSGIQGTGLGLDISRQFVALMGGELKCESEYGKGSVFYFTVRQKIVSRNGIGRFSEKDGNKGKAYVPEFFAPEGRVLVVDDNEMNLTVIKGLLKGTGLQVFTASSGRECMHMLKKDSFHAVLLDHMMPEMDGLETIKRIREEIPERSDVPIIALTANGATDGGNFYKSAGFADYLAKPVDGNVLEKTLKKYLPDDVLEKPGKARDIKTDDSLPESAAWLNEVGGISVDDGLRYCGGAESFVKSIKTFYDMITENADVIEKAYKEEDWELYTVKVHALKSSARIIGAKELSGLAERLEDAGKSGNTGLIREKTGELLELYRSYSKLLSGFENETGKETIDEAELNEAKEALKEFIPQMDYDSAEMVLGEVLNRKLEEKDKAFFETMSVLLKKLDWDEMEKMLSE